MDISSLKTAARTLSPRRAQSWRLSLCVTRRCRTFRARAKMSCLRRTQYPSMLRCIRPLGPCSTTRPPTSRISSTFIRPPSSRLSRTMVCRSPIYREFRRLSSSPLSHDITRPQFDHFHARLARRAGVRRGDRPVQHRRRGLRLRYPPSISTLCEAALCRVPRITLRLRSFPRDFLVSTRRRPVTMAEPPSPTEYHFRSLKKPRCLVSIFGTSRPSGNSN
ncbi:hypothetical protein BV25DRAFT_1221774 [Artomyces pyxidatus]|uniref:Uncharacterized protein n=1 Tax=Artomyces pyxidatus TaxID=48021 RepID=A0ACB8SQN9_9AGAM|nr:hypothetical protein BV25DRAFT_1221774 [Artomyces pyxidatus]